MEFVLPETLGSSACTLLGPETILDLHAPQLPFWHPKGIVIPARVAASNMVSLGLASKISPEGDKEIL